MKLNKKSTPRTHEGAVAMRITPEQQLRRSVLACLLWEDKFYENGISIADRIALLVPQVDPNKVYDLAIEARTKMKLRHVPLLLAREMARYKTHKHLVGSLLPLIIQRADELSEFMAIYWRGGKTPISKQVKKGLAEAFHNFNEYELAKYNRDGLIRLRDVMFMVHPKPRTMDEISLLQALANNTLATPDTWEVALSSGADKKTTWERLLRERKLGTLALLRNLRNMAIASVDETLIFEALERMNTEKILPYRFIAAARHAPQWGYHIERAMMRCLEGMQKLPGKTVLLVDVSGSMSSPLSLKSDLLCSDAANGLAILARELCEEAVIYSFSHEVVRVPDRRGFELGDAIENSQWHGGTRLGSAVDHINETEYYDRLIVITDEQTSDRVADPKGLGYVINVSSYENGIGYGAWTHIDGWSEAVFNYITAAETEG